MRRTGARKGRAVGDVVQMAAALAHGERRRVDDMATRIDALRIEAERRGFTALSYFLDIAVTEALVQANRAGDRAETIGLTGVVRD